MYLFHFIYVHYILILSSFNGNFTKIFKGGKRITLSGRNLKDNEITSADYMADQNNFEPVTGTLTIHTDIDSINPSAFANNKNIKSINIIDRPIGSGTVAIHGGVFKNCDISGILLIPPCVRHIGENAFKDNINITHIYMIDNNSEMSLGQTPFANIPPLELVILPIESYGEYIRQMRDIPNITVATSPELIRIGIKVINDDPSRIISSEAPRCEEILNRTIPSRIAAPRQQATIFMDIAKKVKANTKAQAAEAPQPATGAQTTPVSEMPNKIQALFESATQPTPKGDVIQSHITSFLGGGSPK